MSANTETPWFERDLKFGKPSQMLPYYLIRLEGTVPRLVAMLTGIQEDILSTPLQGKWSIKQNIGHLAEVDTIVNRRIDEMIKGVSPMSPAVFEPLADYNTMSIADVIALLAESRERNISRYEALTPEQLKASSIHPRLKVSMTPVDLAWFDAEHDDHHLLKISLILKNIQNA